jgi:hypothetical protein
MLGGWLLSERARKTRSNTVALAGLLLCRGLLSASSSWHQSGRRRNAHRMPKEERRDFPLAQS